MFCKLRYYTYPLKIVTVASAAKFVIRLKINFFTKFMSFHILLHAMDVNLRVHVGCIYINKSLNKMKVNKCLNLKFNDNV